MSGLDDAHSTGQRSERRFNKKSLKNETSKKSLALKKSVLYSPPNGRKEHCRGSPKGGHYFGKERIPSKTRFVDQLQLRTYLRGGRV